MKNPYNTVNRALLRATLTAALLATVSQFASAQEVRSITISNASSLPPGSARGGNVLDGRIVLNALAPDGGVIVTLFTGDSSLATPHARTSPTEVRVMIPAGRSDQRFKRSSRAGSAGTQASMSQPE